MGKITHWWIFDVPDQWQSDEPQGAGESPHSAWVVHILQFIRDMIDWLTTVRPQIMPGFSADLGRYKVKFGNAAHVYLRDGTHLASFPVLYKTITPKDPNTMFPGNLGA